MIPTGNPDIPPAVCEANEICELIVEKTEGATGSEEELFSHDDVAVDALEEDFAEEEGGGNENEGRQDTVFIFVSMCFLPCSCVI